MNPKGLVRPPPKPTKFTGWSTSSSNGRTGNSWHFTYVGVMTFTWLPLSARVIASLPSTTISTNVSGANPVSCRSSLRNEEEQCVVTTHATTSVKGPSGWAPLCCLGPSPGSLNALYGTYKKCPNADSPWQNGWSPHKQSTGTPHVGSGSLPASCAGSTPPTGLIWEVPQQAPQGWVGTSPHPGARPPYLQVWDTFYIPLYRHLQILQWPSGSEKAAWPPSSLLVCRGC